MSVSYSSALFLSVTTTRTAWFSANTVSFSHSIPNVSFLFFSLLSLSPAPSQVGKAGGRPEEEGWSRDH